MARSGNAHLRQRLGKTLQHSDEGRLFQYLQWLGTELNEERAAKLVGELRRLRAREAALARASVG